jgi:signal transduction histidine kinase
MKSTDLQKNFEPLSWDSNDEIGNLVLEYNKMLAALQQGADKLAENEREGAWREMAQQIAHDIKNPLTPMRLRVQHLARQFDNGNNVQFSDQLKVFIQSMTEQIDTLANIANTFAQLAKTEELPLMTIDVDNFIQHQIDLFKDENTQIVYSNHYTGIGIQAENNSLSRIFSNLITNAIQAKKEDHSLTLTLNVWKNKNQVFIRINDNGTGIPKELLGNLFQPRFTTKTTGSGIGLATAKALMEKMNGQIKCKSKINQGTSFFLVFPITSSTLDTK